MSFDWRDPDDWWYALKEPSEGIALVVGALGAFIVGGNIAEVNQQPVNLLELMFVAFLGGLAIGGVTYATLRVTLWLILFVIFAGPYILIAAAVLAFWIWLISLLSQTYV